MGIFNQQKAQNQEAAAQPRTYVDPYEQTANADAAAQTGVYPLPGSYQILYLDSIRMIVSKKDGVDCLVAEFDIIKSSVPERPPGTHMSYIAKYNKPSTAGNVKALILALTNEPEENFTANAFRYVCSEDNPCHARLVAMEASEIETRTGGRFTKCAWRGLPEDIQEQAEELRAKAGFTPF